MSERVRVARNAGIAMGGEALNLLLTMAGGIITARYLGPSRFGVYAYATSAAWLAMALTDLGTSTLMTRELARDRSAADREMPAMFGLRVAIGVVLCAALFAAAPFISPNPEAAAAIRWCAPALVLSPMGAYYLVLRATERLDLAALVQVLSRAAQLVTVIAAALLDAGTGGMICGMLAAAAATVVAVLILVPRTGVHVRISFDTSSWAALVPRALPFFAMGVLTEIYNRIDAILIPHFDSVEGNGMYGVALRLAFMFTVVPNAVAAAVFPYFSRRSSESKEPLRQGTLALYRYLGLLGFGAAIFVGVPAAEWIALLFGKQYLPAAPALTVLMGCVPLLFFQSVHGSALYALDRQKSLLAMMLVCIALDVALDVVLIKDMGFTGAAYASFATNSVFFVMAYGTLKREFGTLSFPRATAGPAASAFAAGVTLVVLAAFPLYLKIPAAAVVFAACAAATRSVSRDDIILLKNALGKK